jgi:hypothetical protein
MRSLLFLFLLGLPALAAVDNLPPVSTRGLKICVSADAPPVVQAAASQVLAAVATQPLLGVMSGTEPPTSVTDSAALMKGPATARAYNHLIAVGLPNDPIIQAAWQREALMSDKGIYVFGFGNLQGDIGYIESDRNPFLHSTEINIAPFETEIVTLTGTTPAGVQLAVAAFLKQGLINGVVGGPGWSRGDPTLLDHDPLSPDFTLPAVPPHLDNATCVGVTSANESVYRSTLEAAGAKPLEIWQFKYYVPGVWAGVGEHSSVASYLAGLHRMAFDNTLWVARFSDAATAAAAAQQIGKNSHWDQHDTEWIGVPVAIPPKSNGGPVAPSVRLWSKDDSVFISTLPGLDSAKMP